MSRYEVYLFIHIAAAIVWIGGGLFSFILGERARRLDDRTRLRNIVDDLAVVAGKVFVPSSIVVLVMGILMVVDGPWSFGSLWIVLGLVGYAATFVTGIALFEPTVKRVSAAVERDGDFGEAAMTETRKLLVLGRLDETVLLLVVALMVIKPTGDDVGVLVAMAAIVALVSFHVVTKLREIDRDLPATPAPASA
jgi:uncharacterized membrane protein